MCRALIEAISWLKDAMDSFSWSEVVVVKGSYQESVSLYQAKDLKIEIFPMSVMLS